MDIVSRILAEFRKALEVRKGSDLEEDMYVYLRGRWVAVALIDDDGMVDADVADSGPSIGPNREKVSFRIDPEALYVIVRSDAPIKFDGGRPAGARWPVDDIIYVDEAYVGALTGAREEPERVSGLFVRGYGPDEGVDSYVPYRPMDQGLPAALRLSEATDVIVSWHQVSVEELKKAVAR